MAGTVPKTSKPNCVLLHVWLQVSSKQSFELGFNKACALIALGEFAAAESELRMALKLGEEARGQGVARMVGQAVFFRRQR